MREAAKNLDFERAMELRDILFELKTREWFICWIK
jgi:excinuclease UvrABC helicase subunit UvrB